MKYRVTSASASFTNNYLNTGPVQTPNTKVVTFDISIEIYNQKFNALSVKDIEDFLKDTGLPKWQHLIL